MVDTRGRSAGGSWFHWSEDELSAALIAMDGAAAILLKSDEALEAREDRAPPRVQIALAGLESSSETPDIVEKCSILDCEAPLLTGILVAHMNDMADRLLNHPGPATILLFVNTRLALALTAKQLPQHRRPIEHGREGQVENIVIPIPISEDRRIGERVAYHAVVSKMQAYYAAVVIERGGKGLWQIFASTQAS